MSRDDLMPRHDPEDDCETRDCAYCILGGLETDADHAAALAELDALMAAPSALRMNALATALSEYERTRWPSSPGPDSAGDERKIGE